jgi:serine/threonine protein kinase
LVTSSRRACVADFGLSSMLAMSLQHQHSTTTARGGTPRYQAPELLRSAEARNHFGSGVYAFACVGYEARSTFHNFAFTLILLFRFSAAHVHSSISKTIFISPWRSSKVFDRRDPAQYHPTMVSGCYLKTAGARSLPTAPELLKLLSGCVLRRLQPKRHSLLLIGTRNPALNFVVLCENAQYYPLLPESSE